MRGASETPRAATATGYARTLVAPFADPSATDEHWLGALRASARAPTRSVRSARHLTMRDGVRIAIDAHVPPCGPAPAIVHQTRYLRSLAPRGVLGRLLPVGALFDVHREIRRRFLAAGYAWIDVDVRGTGASGGRWVTPWHAGEVRDGGEVVEWIVRQPWSNGRVGALGISYDGTCADMLLVAGHPAVRAVAPLFSLYDAFTDVAFPGGIQLAWFTAAWASYNRALDDDAFHRAATWPLWIGLCSERAAPRRGVLGWLAACGGMIPEARFRQLTAGVLAGLVRGVSEVPGATRSADRELRARNLDVGRIADRVVHRDDAGFDPEWPALSIDSFSPHRFAAVQRRTGAAIYSYSGWRDGAYAHAAIKRFLAVGTPGSRLTLGPFTHAGLARVHAFARSAPSRFDHAGELLSFFDEHVADRPSRSDGCSVHYFTTGAERWRATQSWPPRGCEARTLYLWPAGLRAGASTLETVVAHPVDRTTGSGARSRWRALLGPSAGDYADRRGDDARLLRFESPRLAEPFECTGHPVLQLYVSWNGGDDGQVFAYLEDVAPDGSGWLVSEGQLRALHRAQAASGTTATPAPARTFERADARPLGQGEIAELVFDLLPFSHRFAAGHRLRLALASADTDHFAPPPPGATELRLHLGGARASRIDLPALAPPRFAG